MFITDEKSKLICATSALLITIAMVGCFATACFSLDKETVHTILETKQVGNDELSIEDKQIYENNKKDLRKQILMIDSHQDELIDTVNEGVKIKIDADILIPEQEHIPIARIRPENFSNDQFIKFSNTLSNGNQLYFSDGNQYSKEEIENVINSLKTYQSAPNLPYYIENEINRRIEWFEKKYKGAVNKSDEKKFEGDLQSVVRDYRYTLKAYMGHDIAAKFQMDYKKNKTETMLLFRNHNYSEAYNYFDDYVGVDAERMSTSYDEAKETALDAVRLIDGQESNFIIYDSSIAYEIESERNLSKDESPQGYKFKLARNYNGVDCKLVPNLGVYYNVNYEAQVLPERIEIIVDDSGIQSFVWLGYTQYVETIADDVLLKDFTDIWALFEDDCRKKFNWKPTLPSFPDDVNVLVHVKSVEMNLMPVAENETLETYKVIPVWDFIADIEYSDKVYDDDGFASVIPTGESILTISAIDGTIMNREQGY